MFPQLNFTIGKREGQQKEREIETNKTSFQ
jgi:hypothetical protein